MNGHSKFPSILLFGVCTLASALHAKTNPYQYIGFEPAKNWTPGPLPENKPAVQLIQGTASILNYAEDKSLQVLELGPSSPFSAVFVTTECVATAPVVFCEILAKPAAVNEDEDAEFLDFGGAVLGLFRIELEAEIRALFSRTDEENVWLSTGVRFPTDAYGCVKNWVKIEVRLDRKKERWSLKIDGVEVLSGLRSVPGEAAALPLWLYGQESHPCLFDDVLISCIQPDALERELQLEKLRLASNGEPAPKLTYPKIVTKAKDRATLRSVQPSIQDAAQTLTQPVLRALDGVLNFGKSNFKFIHGVDTGKEKQDLLIYSPQYDDSGNPLPATLSINADAELKLGADLGQIRWMMHTIGSRESPPEVLAVGDFRTGLLQNITIPGAWITKATSIAVWLTPGPPDAHWERFKNRPHGQHAPPVP